MIHIWGLVFVSIAVIKGKWQVSENLAKHHFIGALVSAITNVVLNFLMIPLWGVLGAAQATVISQFISAYFINYFFKDLQGQSSFVHKALRIGLK
jgi:Na+-driven multidrug efflux pump